MNRKISPNDFAGRILRWWTNHGRHDLPWQTGRSPYRVWVSEIMLQQTRVSTVIDYFERFMSRFPTLPDLAEASLDDVLALWSGLGYYARARNLHRTAQRCMTDHDGLLPDQADALQQLPGIGRSTANAIIAQAHNRRAPILDGNVKRVLARHASIDGWPGRRAVLNQLWTEAEARTPPDRAADYTQAIMDLGAKICTVGKPACVLCPVQDDCQARIDGRIDELPGKKPKRNLPQRSSTWLIITDNSNRIALVRRPPSGIWGGLWCLPESDGELNGHESDCLPAIDHQFSHFRLRMHFIAGSQDHAAPSLSDAPTRWFSLEDALQSGLPQPIRQALETLADRMRAHSSSQTDS